MKGAIWCALRPLPRLMLGGCALWCAGSLRAESLAQAWDTALAADQGLRSVQAQAAAAAEAADAARGARWPQLTVEAGRTALADASTIQTEFAGQALQIPVSQRYSTAWQAMATLPLYSGGRVVQGIAAADATLDAARLAQLGAVQELRLRVAEAYVGVLRATRLAALAGKHGATLEAHARDVENYLQKGLVSRSDLLSAQVALADARQQSLRADNALDLARAVYNRLLGRPLDGAVSVDEVSIDPPLEQPLDALTARAARQRSELGALDRQAAALENQAGAARGERLPQIALSGGYVYQENRYQVYEEQWMATLGARWSLFDGGSAGHRAAALAQQAAAASAQRADLASLVELQVRQAWLDVAETAQRLHVTESAVALAEENLRLSRDRYAHGLSSHTDVLDAEALRAGSESNQAAARYDSVLARMRLRRAVGEL